MHISKWLGTRAERGGGYSNFAMRATWPLHRGLTMQLAGFYAVALYILFQTFDNHERFTPTLCELNLTVAQ